MKKIFFSYLCCLSAFFSFAQNDIRIASSLTSFDNYPDLRDNHNLTYWLNNLGLNTHEDDEPVYSGGPGFPMGVPGINASPRPPFNAITTLDPIQIGGIDTQHKPQAKTWWYAGQWWCALPPTIGGTWIFRLDGTTWTPILRLATSGSRTDCWNVGDLVHVLMFKGSGANAIATLQYDPATNTYKNWGGRPSPTNVTFPSGVEAATLTIDGTGRMWVAADAVNDIQVWWSDSPYNTWSASINIASGVSSDDISAVTKLQGKIGVFWSNQNTGLFGFRTHTDGDNPNTWTADERPASQSAIPGNPRMADDHMNLTLSSNGTLYCVAKTSYNNVNLPELILLVRRPNGTWDNLYPVTIGEGSQAIVLLNDVLGKLKIVYTSLSNGGRILYKESPVSNISFTAPTVLMGGPSANYNFSSSTHQTYNPDVAIVATDQGSPRQIVSVLASDGPPGDVTPPSVSGIPRSSPTTQNTTATTVVFAVNFSESVTGVNASDFTVTTGGTAAGNISNVSGSGAAYTVTINNITGTGSLRLDLNASGTGIVDGASNPITGGFTNGETYNVSPGDFTSPSVSNILRSSPTTQNTTATTVVFAVNFSEAVNGVDALDFTLSTGGTAAGSVSGVSGSGAAYTVTVSNITGTGSLRLDLNSSGTGIVDGASNSITGGFTSGETYNVSPGDVTPPSVSGILRSSPTTQNTTATTVVFAVNFSEAVNGVNTSDFSLTIGGTANGIITNVLGVCANYTVTVTSLTGTGTLRLDLKNNGTDVVDAFGNPITGGFSSGEFYIIDPPQLAGRAKIKNTSMARSDLTAKSIEATVFPNPFSNEATFRFTLPQTEKYSIKFYNSSGALISQVDEGTAHANVAKNVKIDGTRLVAGLYMISIQTGNETKVLKVVKE
ncbi:T9SS type A sorting domain-containing protein [Flavitalea sp.]|nr:T9SS type A sorting domain-containing protein [Flavitalea sp.]